MAKDKADKEEKKREKKEKRADKDGVHKSKKDKKEKKDKKDKSVVADAAEKELTTKVLEGIDQNAATEKKPVNEDANEDVEMTQADSTEAVSRPAGAVAPFANPLVEDKSAKKVLKSVKKGKILALDTSCSTYETPVKLQCVTCEQLSACCLVYTHWFCCNSDTSLLAPQLPSTSLLSVA